LEALRAGAFDLVLLDVLMPGLDGYDTLAEIERDEKLRR
jgi:CheY-like chemotaxis protein